MISNKVLVFMCYRSATRYLDPTINIQIVICYKIWGLRCNGSSAMVFLLFEHQNMVRFGDIVTPTKVISFGTAPLHNSVTRRLVNWGVSGLVITGYLAPPLGGGLACTGRGQPLYVINIHAAPVFHQSVDPIPATVAGGFDIDLYNLQIRCFH
jgi:hypothetical protein